MRKNFTLVSSKKWQFYLILSFTHAHLTECCCYFRIGSVMSPKSTHQMLVWRQKKGRIENIKSENSRCHFFRQFSCYTNKNEIHVNNVIIQESKASRAANDECVRSAKEEDKNWKNLKSVGTVFDSVFGKSEILLNCEANNNLCKMIFLIASSSFQ